MLPSRDIEVQDEGTGTAVLCLHGFPQDKSAFDDLARQLVADGFRVVRFDQRGYDDNPVGMRRDYVVRKLAEDCVSVLDQLSIDQCIVVGHDLGGMVAWELARLAPTRVSRALILSVPHPAAFLVSLLGIRQVVRSWYFIPAQFTRLALRLFSPEREASKTRFARLLSSTGMRDEDAVHWVTRMSAIRFVGAIRWYQAMPLSPLTSMVFRIRRPTTILYGTADAVSTRLSIRLSKLFDNRRMLETVELEGAGHWLLDYNAVEVREQVRRLSE